MTNFKFPMKKIFLALLFIVAFLERVAFDLGPNIELITTVMLLSAAYLGRKESFLTIFAIMAVTDFILGNTNIFLFTWSGFLIPAIVLPTLFKKYKATGIKKVGLGTAYGAGSNFFFFIWTNFGVWLLDSWNMYPNTFNGLLMSYINALPFWRAQLISTSIFATLGFSIVEFSLYLEKRYKITSSLSPLKV